MEKTQTLPCEVANEVSSQIRARNTLGSWNYIGEIGVLYMYIYIYILGIYGDNGKEYGHHYNI